MCVAVTRLSSALPCCSILATWNQAAAILQLLRLQVRRAAVRVPASSDKGPGSGYFRVHRLPAGGGINHHTHMWSRVAAAPPPPRYAPSPPPRQASHPSKQSHDIHIHVFNCRGLFATFLQSSQLCGRFPQQATPPSTQMNMMTSR